MNRTQRAIIRAEREALDTARTFKNDALVERTAFHSCLFPQRTDSRFESELDIYKGHQKNLRRLKKYHGPSNYMTENNYMEVMGA